jgi:hypothetical protein
METVRRSAYVHGKPAVVVGRARAARHRQCIDKGANGVDSAFLMPRLL